MKTIINTAHINHLLIRITASTLLIPSALWSQKSQIASNNEISKIALVDYSRVRNEYRSFRLAKEMILKSQSEKEKLFRWSVAQLEAQKKTDLKTDAKKGGTNKKTITEKSDAKKAQITAKYNAEQKRLSQNMKAQMQAYENKIIVVTQILVSRDGFTELKAIRTGESQKGIDITRMILEKLN
jgi:hypothetical protein